MKRPRPALLAAGVAGGLLALGLLWGVGFLLFDRAVRRPAPPPPAADGIVALTGGADRIDEALHLLATGRAPLLLISGVGRGLDLADLVRHQPLTAAPIAPMTGRITLGRTATSTWGNAAETAAWAHAHGMGSLIVVTAGYHMPRALLEIGRALPGVRLYPVPVQPPAMRGVMEWATVRLMASEFDKYLAVRLGLVHRPAALLARDAAAS